MLAAIAIVLFMIYDTALFFITNWYILLLLLVVELCLTQFSHFTRRNLFFILFVMACNLIFSDIETTLLVGLRLFLALEATYLLAHWLRPQGFTRGLTSLLAPLRWCGVDTSELALTLTIALSFIPIFTQEARAVKRALQAKGFDFGPRNLVTRPQVYLLAYLDGLFDRLETVEQALRAKGYE